MRALVGLLAALVLLGAGCGGDDETPQPTAGAGAEYELTDVENALEGAGLAIVRDGPAEISSEVSPSPDDSVHYADRSGAEFEVLVFATRAQARRAHGDIASTELVSDGGAYTTAANVVAALPRPPRDGAFREVWETFRRLAVKAGGSQPGDMGVGPGEIATHPDRYAGQTVTVAGTRVRLLAAGSERPLALVVRGRGVRELLVVPDRGVRVPAAARGPGGPADSPRIRATGVVTRLGEPGGPDVPHEDEALSFRGGDPVLLASSIEVASG
jgi:hypothetical protein